MDKLVSMIVPIYNVEKYVEKCIDSIISQTYHNLEIILVNDGSTDSSLAICEQFLCDSRVKLLTIENSGQSMARNMGLDIAHGEYIMFSDADDFYDKDAVEILLNSAIEGGFDIVIGGLRYLFKNYQYDMNVFDKTVDNNELMEMFCKENNIISSPVAKIYKRELFEKLRYPIGKIYEDRYLSMDIFARVKKALFIEKTIYNYVQRKTSTVHNGFNNKRLDYIDISRREVAFIKENYPNLSTLVDNKIADDIFEVIKWVLLAGYGKNKDSYNELVRQLKLEENQNGKTKYRFIYANKYFARLVIQCRLKTGKMLRKLKLRGEHYKYFD